VACQVTHAARAAEPGARAAEPGAHAVGDAAAVQRGQAGERAGRIEARGRLAQAALLLQQPEQLAACKFENPVKPCKEKSRRNMLNVNTARRAGGRAALRMPAWMPACSAWLLGGRACSCGARAGERLPPRCAWPERRGQGQEQHGRQDMDARPS
jgi:hypothetical protein